MAMFYVGTGVADISAASGTPLGGYWGRPAGGCTSVRDPLTARVVAVAVADKLVGVFVFICLPYFRSPTYLMRHIHTPPHRASPGRSGFSGTRRGNLRPHQKGHHDH